MAAGTAAPGSAPVSPDQSTAGPPARLDASAWAWAFYEGARNPYVILCTIYILAPYIVTQLFADPVVGQATLSEWHRNAGILVAISAPVLGAIADRYGQRKPFLLVVTMAMVPLIFAMWWAVPLGQAGLPVAVVGLLVTAVGVLFAWSEVLHNSMLGEASRPATLAMTSGIGLALGNLVSTLFLVVVLVGIALPGQVALPFVPDQPIFGLDPATHETSRVVAPISAVWFALAAIPLFLLTRDSGRTAVSLAGAVVQGIGGMRRLVVDVARNHANAGRFLLARMLYVDGKVALLIFGGVVASGVFGWDLLEATAYGLLLSVFAVVGGFLCGVLDNRIGPRNAVILELLVTMACLAAMVTQAPGHVFLIPVEPGVAVWGSPVFATLPELVYLGAAMIIAISVTAAFGSSRTLLSTLAPPERMGEFFGLYGLAGSATVWLGPMLVGAFTTGFQSQMAGLAAILILLAAGLVMMLTVRSPARPDGVR